MELEIRTEHLSERRMCVRRHPGTEADVELTRRPMYQRMIMEELVGGPGLLRFDRDASGDETLDIMIGATCGYEGDDDLAVEVLREGQYAVCDWEGPETEIPHARAAFLDAVAGKDPEGRLLQVHMMDAIDGLCEQRFEIRLV